MLTDEAIARYEESLNEEESIEETFRRLRSDGLSRLEAVRVILAVLDVSLREAKRVLVTNDTWAEALDETNASEDTSDSSPIPPAPG